MSYRHQLITALTAGLLAVLGAGAAYAATATDTSQFAVTAGSLAFATAPNAPNLPALTLTGQAQTLNAQMANFAVNDATGSAAGWNVTVSGDNGAGKSPVFKVYCPNATCGTDSGPGYVAGGQSLAANSLTLSSTGASFSAQNGSTGTAPAHQCASACNMDAAPASPVKVATAAASAGMGTWATAGYGGSSVALSAPTTIEGLEADEVFRVDLLWSLNSGP